jgi:hypothetical protein
MLRLKNKSETTTTQYFHQKGRKKEFDLKM